VEFFPDSGKLPEMPDFTGNIERFTGFASHYDHYRPGPPAVLAPLLIALARSPRPALVVDLGCGTGLSTRYWAGKAEQVIGVDPTDSMREEAGQAAFPNITYRKAFSHETGLPDRCATIVTCSQSLHWMDPLPTFREAARILQPGGVFAAYDYDWPPATGHWEADAAYEACMARGRILEKESGIAATLQRWEKSSHLARMRESGVFRYAQETLMHHTESGNAARLIGLLASQGWVASLRKLGLSDAEIGFDALRETLERVLGGQPRPWHWSSRMRWGIV
jgi:ubiquinone/menaquinone biosynthesis C-methylase UbiE